MGTEEALLAAVLEDPDDDLPRLALADWWEGRDEWEGGDQRERAEFVRVQVELAVREARGQRSAEATDHLMTCSCAMCALRRREGELHWSPYLWAPGGPRWHDAPVWGFEWRRGFIHAATCVAADWLKHGNTISAPVPLPDEVRPWHPVEEVTLTTTPWSLRPGRLDEEGLLGELRGRWPRVRHWHLPPRVEPARTHGAPWQAVPLDSWQWG